MDGIQGTLSRFTAAFSQLDLDGMMICYASDATAFFPIAHHASFLDGKEEISEAFAKVISKIRAAGFNSIKCPRDSALRETRVYARGSKEEGP